MTAGEFAASDGVSVHTLRHWAWKLGRERETRALSRVPPMIEVRARPVADDRFEIEVGGRRVRVPATFDSEALRRLLAVVAEEA